MASVPFLQGLDSTKETADNAVAGLLKLRLGGAPDTAAGAGREGRISLKKKTHKIINHKGNCSKCTYIINENGWDFWLWKTGW